MKRLAAALLSLALAASLSGAAPSRLAPSPDGEPSARQTTPLSPTTFLGYPEAYVLHNDHIHAVIVPAISRLAFLASSPDSPNLLRLDPALADAGALPPDPSTAPDFFNIGGDWVWPVAQSNWPAFSPNASDWPPPPALADAPSTAEAWTDVLDTTHVLLTRHYPAPVHATLTRDFYLIEDTRVLYCKQTLTRDPDAPADALPLSLWHISQVAKPNCIRFLVPSSDFTPYVMSGSLDPDAYSVVDHPFLDNHPAIASYTPPLSSEVKFSTPSLSFNADTPNGSFGVQASDPAHTELYSNTGLGYAELETVSPESSDTLSNLLIYFPRPAP